MANQPKNYKKFVATAATATLVASAIVPVASAASFSDIEGNTHADAIKALSDAGIIKGYEDGTFKPNAEINRGQTVKLLGRWLETKGYKVPENWNTVQRFNDLPVNAADQELVKYAALVKDAGVFNGSNGNLNYSQPMQRQQMALVLVRAIKTVEGIDLIQDYKEAGFTSSIKDLDKAYSTENVEAITALEYAGITVVENFNPTSAITRGQFASFLNRTINYEAPVKELKVESVSAINGKQIEVKFNQDVERVSAEYLGNYKIQRNTDVSPVSLASLGVVDSVVSVGNVVTITFDNDILTDLNINKDTLFKFTVSDVKASNGTVLKEITTSLSVNDVTGPELLSASAAAKTTTNKVTLVFSEPVQATGALVTVDGKSATVQAGNDYNELIVTTSANLEAGKTYDVTVLNVKDAANNFLTTNPTRTTVTVASDVVAPTITGVNAVRDNLIAVTFDKAIDENTLSGQIKLVDASGNAKGGTISASTSADKKTVYVSLGTEDFFGNGTTFTGTLYFSDKIADVSGNTLTATNQKVTLTKDTSAPVATSVKHLPKGTLYNNGVNYANGALVLVFDESVTTEAAIADVKLLNPSGEAVETTYLDLDSAVSNAANDKEIIIPVKSGVVLPADTYRVVLSGGEAKDKSFQTNANGAKTLTVTTTLTSTDTDKPEVALTGGSAYDITETAATSLTSGTKIAVKFTDNVALDLDSIQDVNNYLLDGAALPEGSYVTVNITGGTANAATAVTATINIPKNSITKEGTHVLNIVNVKDKAGNVLSPVTKNVTLVDDVAPVFTSATVASNGSLVLGFSEAVTFGTAPVEEFKFSINGTVVAGTNEAITAEPGIGNDAGKLVVTFAAMVDEGADGNADTTADNRVYIDVNGNRTYDTGDILVTTGTTKDIGVTTVTVNDLTSLEVSVVDVTSDANIKDGSSLNNSLVAGTKIIVK